MPVPSPHEGEDKDAFISRCISTLRDSDTTRPADQIVAMCFGKWRGESLHDDFRRILNTFTGHFNSDGSGLQRFLSFVSANKLNISKPYNPMFQFSEAFEWTKPLIRYMRQDKDAKYYGITALTANISMNDNDYRNYQEIIAAAPSMKVKPVDINHDHNRWLPFPRTRVDMTGAEDMALELTLRVHNSDKWLQDALDNGDIIHPSIEGFKQGDSIEFTGLALLEKGIKLPGDPLTTITPLLLNESVTQQLCKVVDGQLICKTGVNESKREEKTLSEQTKTDFINQCLETGKTNEECEAEWNKKQEPAVTETDEQPAVVTANPPPQTEYPTENKEVFMTACLAANADDADYCENLWTNLQGEEPTEPWRTDQYAAGENKVAVAQEVVRLNKRILQLETMINVSQKNETLSQATILEIKGKVRSLEEDVKEGIRKHSVQRQTIEVKNRELKQKDREITKIKEDQKQLRTKDKEALLKQNHILEDQLDACKGSNLTLRKENLDADDARIKADRRADKAHREKIEVLQENADTAEKNVKVQQELNEATKQISSLNVKLSDLTSENTFLTKSKDDETKELRERLNTANLKNHKLSVLTKQMLRELQKQGKALVENDKILTEDDL